MTEWVDRILAGVFDQAGDLLGAEFKYGRLLWAVGGSRAYEMRLADRYRLTLVTGGDRPPLVLEVVGVDGALL